jgi:hypothetical protein
VVLQNLELILLEACAALEQLAEHLLEELEATLIGRLARPTVASQTPAAPLVPITPAASVSPGSAPTSVFDTPAHTPLFQHEREVDEAAAGARLVRSLLYSFCRGPLPLLSFHFTLMCRGAMFGHVYIFEMMGL